MIRCCVVVDRSLQLGTLDQVLKRDWSVVGNLGKKSAAFAFGEFLTLFVDDLFTAGPANMLLDNPFADPVSALTAPDARWA